MASLAADLATSVVGLAYRNTNSFTRVRATFVPLLFRTRRSQSHVVTYSTSRIAAVNIAKSKRGARRFTVTATSTATPQSESSDVSTKIPPDNRIPATIITGFLGSGKTTLLNHILTAEHGKKIAVIENEFGEVDIDGSLVAAKTTGAEDIIMLNNGCLCCTVRGDLVRMISELVSKKKGKFDHIVIETTGLANPAPIIQTFYAEDEVFNDVKLDGVVTLVDAKHAGLHLDEVKPKGVVNEAVEQIAYADRIIVNKTDLVGESEIASLVQRIRKINGLAHLKRTEFGKVDLDYVLGIGGFDLERIESAVDSESKKESHDHDHDHHHHHHEHDHEHEHHHDHHDHHSHDHTHDPGVSSVSIVCEGSLDLEKANIWLGTLLLERSEDIYRMKGLLSVEGMNERFVFQGVHDIFQGSPDRLWGPDEPRFIFHKSYLPQNIYAKHFRASSETALTPMGNSPSLLTQYDIEDVQDHCNNLFSQQEIVSLYQRFCQLDRNGKGFISADEFLSVPEFAMNPLSQRLLKMVDGLNFKDFVAFLSAFSPKASTEQKIEFIFKVYDSDCNGKVSFKDILEVLSDLSGPFMSKEQREEVLSHVLQNAGYKTDSYLKLGDFIKVLGHSGLKMNVEVLID
ncbi:hypothetical protein L6164_005521 [Bauhinia variegata]|uniref:Uncharacterized protein n=1 Tax=Bauhinia variegata TaxID=167791 RepID=A0ACB9PRJ4_BAUVA|nr:hypothetical protein L6164_005521 [Bauhinia variegata]